MKLPAIARSAAAPAFRKYLTDLLVEICNIDTSPRADVALSQRNEAKVFDILEREFKSYGFAGGNTQRPPIDPAIREHPFFSNLYYTMSPENPGGLPVERCYAGRTNLLLRAPGSDARDGTGGGAKGVNLAIDAHIDVIAPYFPPRVEGDRVFGRGACDDKGNVAALMGAMKLVGEHLKAAGPGGSKLARSFSAFMVIEEETGGNGSLSLALDRELKKTYDSLMVLEICESRIHPGNRGAVWYKAEAKIPGVNMFEAAAFVVEEFEKEGRAIRSESDHPLFPHRPVQTCHGIIGGNGQHPSRINGDVSFDIEITGGDAAKAQRTIRDVIEDGLKQYVGIYGDKTQAADAKTGKPKVDHHYDFSKTAAGYRVRVFGSTGHMGSIFENDGAITKMMTMVRCLVRSRGRLATLAGTSPREVRLRLADWSDPSHLLMEGGQGFLPTHPMEEVQRRYREAGQRGLETYLGMTGYSGPGKASDLNVTYDKLHNAAFAGPADSPDMLNAIEAAKAAGIWRDEPIRGWDVSCDSRVFACEYPGLPVLTGGPGSLSFAHSDFEQIEVPEMVKFAEFLAYFILKQTGTVD